MFIEEKDKNVIDITLPHLFEPRPYQLPILEAFLPADPTKEKTRGVAIWHRRSGKDKTFFNILIAKARQRVGVYYYFFPTYKQGRKILWQGIDKNGTKILHHIPRQIIAKQNDQEMMIELDNGSIIQIIGTDDLDSIVGTNPVGCVFSEYSLQNPQAWDFIRPILTENGGWAIFNFTPRGKNHAWSLYKMAKQNPNWFCQVLTVDDTVDENGKPFIAKEAIENERAEGMDEAILQQEFYCSFEGAIAGAYYAERMNEAFKQDRVRNIPYDPLLEVHTAWDLGMDDSTVIWFFQCVNDEIRLIDYYENQNKGIEHYVRVLREKSYIYGKHFAPHDIKVKEMGTGKSRKEMFKKLGVDFKVTPSLSIEDGINAVRAILPKCYFDVTLCDKGLNALVSYHKEYDEEKKTWGTHPEHDWSSHASDAFRYLAINYKQTMGTKPKPEDKESYDKYALFV